MVLIQMRVKGGKQQEGDSNCDTQYLAGTGRGYQGGATRPAEGQCWGRSPTRDEADRGYLHME